MIALINSIIYLVAAIIFFIIEIVKSIVIAMRNLQQHERSPPSEVSRTQQAATTAAKSSDAAPVSIPADDGPEMPDYSAMDGYGFEEVPMPTDVPETIGIAKPKRDRKPKQQESWEGTLEDFGIGQFTETKSRKPGVLPRTYTSFFVSIETSNGIAVQKQGVELEKAISMSGVQIGDTIRLTFFGKEEVPVQENGETVMRLRNRWHIEKLS